MSQIPKEIHDKITEKSKDKFPYPEITVYNEGYIANRCKRIKDNQRIEYENAAHFGYQLAAEEIQKLKEENESLNETIRLMQMRIEGTGNEY